MPAVEVRAFRTKNGRVPVDDWLGELEISEPRFYAKCLARILELSQKGYEMRRPNADFLRDKIYELRATTAGIHYRILYFFQGKNAVVLSHGLIKEAQVPAKEIDLAIERRKLVEQDESRYTADFEI